VRVERICLGVFLEQPQSRIHRTIQISHIADQCSINAVVLDTFQHPIRRNSTPPSGLCQSNVRKGWLGGRDGVLQIALEPG
jgi:hypothetical protein